MCSKLPKSQGFTLIESLVALVILSFVYAGVWGWLGTAAQSIERFEEAVALPSLFEQYLDHMSLEPLREKQSGVVAIDGFLFDWEASVNRQSDQEVYRRQPSLLVTLFDVNVRILLGEKLVTTVSTQLVRQWPNPDASKEFLQ